MVKKLLEKKIIKGMIPFVFAIVLVSVTFQACQKDEIPNEAIQSFQLKSATFSADDIDVLIQKVENYITNGDLESGLANAFIVKLDNAKKSLEKENEKASINQLQALMNQLTGLVKAGTIETSIGEGIIFDIKVIAGENPIFTDARDNREYKTIKIGEQVWMAENLSYLPAVYQTASGSDTDPRYYVYGYDGTDINEAKAKPNYSVYGVLYNWPAAKNACPDGWHIPTHDEWLQLSNFLVNNGYGYEGSGSDIAKALASTSNWLDSDIAGTPGNDILSNNTCGFSGLPGGQKILGFNYIGLYGHWWSSTEMDSYYQWARYLHSYNTYLILIFYPKANGLSVRCVRD